jgi:hypothetical protein
MNVKITYSVPFERIPLKIEQLAKEASSDLHQANRDLEAGFSADESDIIHRLDAIEKVRRKLAEVDFLLEDCYTILATYNKTVADMKLPRKKEEMQHEPSNSEQG